MPGARSEPGTSGLLGAARPRAGRDGVSLRQWTVGSISSVGPGPFAALACFLFMAASVAFSVGSVHSRNHLNR